MRELCKLFSKIKKSSFNEILPKANSVTFHQCNLQVLTTKFFKVKMHIAPKLIDGLSKKSSNVKLNS